MNSKLFAALTGVVIIFATHGLAVEVTEPAGAEHGYPGLCDINGKKLADGEFRQWMENGRLHVIITYKFPDGQFFEENAVFRQEPELIQEKWSWKELKNEKPQREFAADFLAGTASAHILKDNKDVTDKIDIVSARPLPDLDSPSHSAIYARAYSKENKSNSKRLVFRQSRHSNRKW